MAMIVLANTYVEGLVVLAGGVFLGFWLYRWKENSNRSARESEKAAVLEAARREADTIVREAKLSANEEALKVRSELENHVVQRKQEAADLEQRLSQREAQLNHQLEDLAGRENHLHEERERLQQKETQLEAERQELNRLVRQRKEQLGKQAHLSEADARAMILKEVEQSSLQDANDLTRHILDEAREKAEDEARRIISLAIQRYAGEHTFETTTATLALPNEEIKGRIIGREGRNIRAFESATGVTVLIDDTPNAVVLSAFDPVRREIAREAMARLVEDGRIHPTRIEEVVAKVTEEIDEAILRAGEEALFKVNLPPMHTEIMKVLGRLRFRLSYSQNLLDHSIEVAHLMGLIAGELGLDIQAAKRAGLLHDIGKALNHEVEGTHALVGADFIRRYGESEYVANGVASHHDETSHTNPLGILVSAADAISASRPGARSETMTTYLKRLEDLEKIGASLEGVEKCFAVQAGRELRVMVQPDRVSDEEAYQLARNLVRRIQDELQYPGQIRVTVIRETRCVEFAK